MIAKLQENLSDSIPGDDKFADIGFNVHTSVAGYNCGREYCFCVESYAQLDDWIAILNKSSKLAKAKFAKRTLIETYRVRPAHVLPRPLTTQPPPPGNRPPTA